MWELHRASTGTRAKLPCVVPSPCASKALPCRPRVRLHLPALPSPSSLFPSSTKRELQSRPPNLRPARCCPGHSGESQPTTTASRWAQHRKKRVPFIDLEFEQPEHHASPFFPDHGCHHRFCHRVFPDDPLANYPLSKHPLVFLYHLLSLIWALPHRRSATSLDRPRRPCSLPPAHLGVSLS